MRRLVYSPTVHAFIKADEGVIDISPWIVSGSLDRKINQVSTAQITLRNPIKGNGPELLWTDHVRTADNNHGPRLHPMDPIIIVMTRLKGYPVQVFTGYLDKAPYLQLFPGLCTIEASCTLKRLLYTQWDAALPFVTYFLAQYGWIPNGDTGTSNPNAELSKIKVEAGHTQGEFNDGSIGALLYAVLNSIGQWDSHNIWIEALPDAIRQTVLEIWNDTKADVTADRAQFKGLLTQILGENSQGSGSPSGGPTSGGTGATWRVKASSEGDVSGNGWTELSTNGNGAAASGRTQSPCCTGNSVGCCDFATLGKTYPAGTMLKITDVTSNKSGIFPRTDIGNGSSFGPAIGLTPTVQRAISWSGGDVIIQLANGDNLSVASGFGTLLSTSTSSGKKKGNTGGSRTSSQHSGSTAPTHSAFTPAALGNGLVQTNAQRGGRSPGGKTGSSPGKIYAPVPGGQPGSPYGMRNGRMHKGLDVPVPIGTPCVAPVDGTIGIAYACGFAPGEGGSCNQGGGMVHFIFPSDTGSIKAGTVIGWGHISELDVSSGQHVTGGTVVAKSGTAGTGPHVHFIARHDDATSDGSFDPTALFEALQKGSTTPAGTAPGSSATTGTTSGSGNAVAAAFSTYINLPSIFDQAEALCFTGRRSFIADQPLFPFVEQLCQASMRSFMSMPNGNFFAFFPDYFGLYGRHYYWEITDIEIIDGRIDLSDDPLVTHVAVAGDVTQFHQTVDVFDLLMTSGIFTIFDAFQTGFIGDIQDRTANSTSTSGSASFQSGNKRGDKVKTKTTPNTISTKNKEASLAFLQKYGARPYVEQVPAIRSPFFELFFAFQKFMLLWAKQFQTTFELTFMPELFPGGIVAFPSHHVQCFIEEVQHNWNYEQGFTTTVNLSAPSIISGDSDARSNLSEGLARPLR